MIVLCKKKDFSYPSRRKDRSKTVSVILRIAKAQTKKVGIYYKTHFILCNKHMLDALRKYYEICGT